MIKNKKTRSLTSYIEGKKERGFMVRVTYNLGL